MASVKIGSVREQNANRIAGVQIDTAVYVGTGATNPIIQVGRDAPVYVMEGTQTAVIVNVVAGLINAYQGAAITVKIGTGAVTTSAYRILNGSFAGAVVANITSGVGREATVVFDGVSWRGNA